MPDEQWLILLVALLILVIGGVTLHGIRTNRRR
jgi:hypothetical protein